MLAPKKVDLLLSGCDVVTIDGKNRVIANGAVAIKGNKIVWIGKASAARKEIKAISTIDGSGQIAMPGLIDGHVHTAQTLLRGKIAEIDRRRPVKIPVWWNYYVPFEGMLTDDDVYLKRPAVLRQHDLGRDDLLCRGGRPASRCDGACRDRYRHKGICLPQYDRPGAHWPKSMITTTKKALDDNVALVKRWKGTRGGTDRCRRRCRCARS